MDDDALEETLAQFKEKRLGGWGILQLTAGTGLAVYAMWAGVLMPGFRRVPLKLQVPYMPASKRQVGNVMTLLKGRSGGFADLGSGDGRIVLEASQQGFSPAVGYELNPWLVRLARFYAWRAGQYNTVSYRREDLWKVSQLTVAVSRQTRFISMLLTKKNGRNDHFYLCVQVDLSGYKNISVFLAPSVLTLLQEKLLTELPEDALIVAGRFPFPNWAPCRIEGEGVDRAWAYHMKALRKQNQSKNITSTEHTR
uniref:Adenine nucleotide translocase lysine methyltransferase n=1 Tax=Pygocentrus nattereri TaxID=42514 RepID=A0AAR2IS20_PYGNA